jgi:hypothetical protein
MPELITEGQFSVWFGVACALWTGACLLIALARHRRSGFAVAAAGPVAYLLWLAYEALAPLVDITRVSGVLILAAAFALVGCALGWLLVARRSA